MGIGRRIVSIAAAIWITAGLAGAAHAEPLRISYSIWVGNGPFFVAQEKGFFAREGVEVELINIEDPRRRLRRPVRRPGRRRPGRHAGCAGILRAGRSSPVSACSRSTIRAAPTASSRPRTFRPSPISRASRWRSPRGSISQFYLNVLLKEAGLSEADIEVVDLSAEDAGQAFLMQEVDAAVTNEPWLTQAQEMPSTAIS